MPSVSPLKVCELRVIGCVQGVGFRLATREKARSLDVFGWVRNLADGSVEVRARGPSQSVDQLIAWLWQGPPTAKVRGFLVARTEGRSLRVPSGRFSDRP